MSEGLGERSQQTMIEHCPECGTSVVWERKTKQPRYRCGNGHTFDSARKAIDWDELKPCYKRVGELWNPYRVCINVEDFGSLNVEVDTEGMQEVVRRFVEVSNEQAV